MSAASASAPPSPARAPRIDSPLFRRAVDFVDAGDVASLRQLLTEHPELGTARAEEDGAFAGSYFARPTLLHFVANNPIRAAVMPPNALAVTDAILDAGADVDAVTLGGNPHTTLGMVASGQRSREAGVQVALIELLVRRGANPSLALDPAVVHHERDAIAALLRLGAEPGLEASAGVGDVQRLRRHLASDPPPSPKQIARAMHWAASNGQRATTDALLDAGLIDVNAELEPYGTAAHWAAYNGHRELLEHLLARGADPSRRDREYGGDLVGWADHAGQRDIAMWLRARKGVQS